MELQTNKATVNLYTDGSCLGNPGPGGWSCVLEFGGTQRRMSGYEADTTNNRMELKAVIAGLNSLKQNCNVTIYTDSQYVKNAFTEGWLNNWITKNWVTAKKEPVKNQDLWRELVYLRSKHRLSWEWVRGHSGHVMNEICDTLAREAALNKKGIDIRCPVP